MFALIKREIEDNVVLFIVAVTTAAIFVTIVVSDVAFGGSFKVASREPFRDATDAVGVPLIMYQTLGYLMPFLPIAAAAVGAVQMNADRNKKISTFLSTLSTTRNQILIAKIITGLLWILVVLVPIVAADFILIKYFARVAPGDTNLLIRMIATAFLSSLACYSLGLLVGWNQSKFYPVMGIFFLSPLLLLIVLIKGFGIETAVIFLSFSVVLLIKAWQKFMTASL